MNMSTLFTSVNSKMLRAITQKVKQVIGVGVDLETSSSVVNKNIKFEAVQTTMVRPTLAAVAAVTQQVLRPLKPHSPSIRFRKGGPAQTHSPNAPGRADSSSSASSASSGGVLEDWQLPSRYRRRPIDENEIAYINRGGPDV